jgi:hypothetical protein
MLASVADLKVISRTSTAKYKSKPEDLKTVSQQLGVANVVEGTVQRAADKVRVNVQLIDARADAHLWAKTYDRDVKDVFAVVERRFTGDRRCPYRQSSRLRRQTIWAIEPTKDPEAYDLFLKGEYEERAAESSLKGEGSSRRQPCMGRPSLAIQTSLWHRPLGRGARAIVVILAIR